MKVVYQCSAALLALSLFCGCSKSAPKMPEGAKSGVAGYVCQQGQVAKLQSAAIDALKREESDFATFLSESGLDASKPTWYAASVTDLPTQKQEPSGAIAIGCDHDLGKIVGALKKLGPKSDAEKIKEQEIAGLNCFVLQLASGKNGANPCLGSVNGKVLLFASSTDVMEKQIALYRDGKGQSSALPASLFSNSSDLFHLAIPDAGNLVAEAAKQTGVKLSEANNFVPNGENLLRSMGLLEVVISSRDGNSLDVAVQVQMAKEEDAKTACDLLNGLVLPVREQLEKFKPSNDEKKLMVEVGQPILKSLEISQNGKTVTAKVHVDEAALQRLGEQLEKLEKGRR